MIHKYGLNGYWIVLDVNSGAVHQVDKLLYDLLDYACPPVMESCPEEAFRALDGYTRQELEEAWSELAELYRREQLFSGDDYDVFVKSMESSPVKAMCLNVSHDCNLRCEYCFAGKGDYQKGRMLMPLEVGKKAVDYLIQYSGGRKNLEVDFFGGEPLMNFEAVRQIVAYAREKEKLHDKRFRFTITTNGMLLDDEKTAYINREMSNVVLSLDGRKSVTDRVRARVDGSGCYDRIVPRFQAFAKARGDKEYYVRGTFTGYNKDFSNDVDALYALGFDQISVEPVVADPKQPYALTEKDLPELYAEYERLAEKIIASRKAGHFYNFFHFMLDLDQGPCAIKRLRGCGCGNEYIAVTPDGDVYPCHQFIGHEQWKMGSVMDGTLDQARKKQFAGTTVYSKEDCRECWARFYCSGGCNANNMQYEGDIRIPHKLSCDLEKKRLECAIMIQAALAEDGAGV